MEKNKSFLKELLKTESAAIPFKDIILIVAGTMLYLLMKQQVMQLEFSFPRAITLFILSGVYLSLLANYLSETKKVKRRDLGIYFFILFSFDVFHWLFTLSLFGYHNTQKLIEENWLASELGKILIIVTLLFIRRKNKKLPKKVWLLLTLLLMTAALITIGIVYSANRELLLLPILLMGLFYLFIYFVSETYRSNYEYQMNEQKYLLLREHFQEIEKQHETIRILKHDMKSQLSNLYGHIQQANYPQLHRQIESLMESTKGIHPKHFTSHRTMNRLLEQKYHQAQSQNINCKFDIQLEESIDIPDDDLIQLVSNLLDNSIEACTYREAPFIQIRMLYQQKCLMIHCQNSFNTCEKEQQQHTRTESIKCIIRKYHGELTHEWKEQSFSVDLNLFET